MVSSPAAQTRVGLLHLSKLSILTLIAAAVLLYSSPAFAADTEAQTVLRKMQAAYKGAKTYQCKMKIVVAGKTGMQEIKIKNPNLYYARRTQENTLTSLMVSDGKSLYTYVPARKMYAKQAAPTKVSPSLNVSQLALDMNTAKMLPVATVNGHSAYVVQAYQALDPRIPAAQLQQARSVLKPLTFTIDKSTYFVVRFLDGRAPAPFDIVEQSVNSAIADSAFTFTPPPGVTQYIPPPPGQQAPGQSPPKR